MSQPSPPHTPTQDSQQVDREQHIIELKQLVDHINSGTKFSRDEHLDHLKLLHDFECWHHYFTKVDLLLADVDQRQANSILQDSLSVCFNFIEDKAMAEKYLLRALQLVDISFPEFWRVMILKPMKIKDFALEASLLESIVPHSQGEFLEEVLARLAILYEEKLYSEDHLLKTLSRLIEANPRNHKALIFYKNFYSQRHHWAKVEGFLKTLIDELAETSEEYFYRLELAKIYLHFLDQPEEATEIMSGVTSDAGFEMIKVKFMLFFHAGEFRQGIDTLKVLEQLATDGKQLANVYFHYATSYASLNNHAKSFAYFEKSLQKDVSMYVIRKYWRSSLQYRNFHGILSTLEYITKITESSKQKTKALTLINKYLGHL
ncbi:MAG: hypothetical protein OXC40_03105 [Proteobacteria bacterium]|nr:hypothetical protein [Pseudomonadota bacterium]